MKKTAAIMFTVAMISSHHAMSHGGGVDDYGCHEDSRTGTSHCHDEETDVGGTLLRIGALALVGVLIQSFLASDDEQHPAVPQFTMSTKPESENGGPAVLQLNWAYRF